MEDKFLTWLPRLHPLSRYSELSSVYYKPYLSVCYIESFLCHSGEWLLVRENVMCGRLSAFASFVDLYHIKHSDLAILTLCSEGFGRNGLAAVVAAEVLVVPNTCPCDEKYSAFQINVFKGCVN